MRIDEIALLSHNGSRTGSINFKPVKLMQRVQKITPCLWFDSQEKKQRSFIFRSSRTRKSPRFRGTAKPERKFTVDARISHDRGLRTRRAAFYRPQRRPNLSVATFNCETQEEVDDFWVKLSPVAIPMPNSGGWLKDKFGVSWQIVPTILPKLLTDPDHVKSQRVMTAMLQMKKIEIAGLERAYSG
jgi:predicted 3-demethylubiquinone-9 3-methyltransferase (glyoxalase superfamily)